MSALLSELGKKLAERWLSLLVLPGVLYLAVAVVAHTLGQGHPFSISRLTDQVTAWTHSPAATVGGQVVLLASVLVGAAGVGLVAQALGSLTERLCLAADWNAWPSPLKRLTRWRVTYRQQRWTTAYTNWDRLRDEAASVRARGRRAEPVERHAAQDAMTRIAHEWPARPTWSGDRIHAVAVRLEREHHLDLAVIWPYLWLILPDTTRTEIAAARQALTRATTMTAWALLYIILTVWWWPAALIATVLALTGRARIRSATDSYALLLGAATHLHARDLAERLGLPPGGHLTPDTGADLTDHLRPTPPPPPPSAG
ncbi:hypothetical protein OG266_38450 [Streptomyces sp. NBC_00554]|uniref:hypothetical protein n=1 Tax=Streptomyces sp. NBC_00554 TaxID=2903661 RepID=UPI00352D79E0|nr:hypothetical protein OG266_38450 [Streptomyces sp. NBC_00554]